MSSTASGANISSVDGEIVAVMVTPSGNLSLFFILNLPVISSKFLPYNLGLTQKSKIRGLRFQIRNLGLMGHVYGVGWWLVLTPPRTREIRDRIVNA